MRRGRRWSDLLSRRAQRALRLCQPLLTSQKVISTIELIQAKTVT